MVHLYCLVSEDRYNVIDMVIVIKKKKDEIKTCVNEKHSSVIPATWLFY